MDRDYRLYVTEPGWRVAIKPEDGRVLYCFLKEEGADGYPRIATGEIYLTNDTEVYSLNSAIKKGFVTADRPTLEGRR